ncbi:hypothetical protein [Microbacterium marmarense]|uniref:Aminoglycoside phosphotransferase domain-containing protein n=1 Tax=Microbacterium marmarense TaxID=3122051 RepID=A0ABU8LT42_9MICO
MEEHLSGGNMSPVLRSGATVRRETGEWTPAVHELLNTMTSIDEVPAVIGLDDANREVLTFLPGETLAGADPAVLWSESVLTSAAQLLRRMHDASVELVDDRSLVWRSPSHRPTEVICHNDFAPYNLIVRGGVLSGVSTVRGKNMSVSITYIDGTEKWRVSFTRQSIVKTTARRGLTLPTFEEFNAGVSPVLNTPSMSDQWDCHVVGSSVESAFGNAGPGNWAR